MSTTTKNFNYDYLDSDTKAIQRSISNHLVYSIGKDPITATDRDWLYAISLVVRDRLIERWMETQRRYYRDNAKRVYYLSLEFLIGRSLGNALLNVGFWDSCTEALRRLGKEIDVLKELEHDAALGNGGLGRLAACLLDSMATLGIPAHGYGIRYDYGMFRQRIEQGRQREYPETWLANGNPWEFPRPEVAYPIRFGGHVETHDEGERRLYRWVGGEEVLAVAHDTPIPGYLNDTVNNLRLWSARAIQAFDLDAFNKGDYVEAVARKAISENLSKVLYPDDSTFANQELRLRQQYFFVSASLRDILRRFFANNDDLMQLPERVAIQLNDTHPAIAIPELMRLLMDQYLLEWGPAWDITVRTFSYTNHTLLPEALETWPVSLLQRQLPRHLQIIFEINRRFINNLGKRRPGDWERMRRLSIIDESGEKRVRMAHLAVIGSHRVNGVSALHTELLQRDTFRDFHEHFPDRLVNVTNGITPRRWLNEANRGLAELICEAIGPDWQRDLGRLRRLESLVDDAAFTERFMAVKARNKQRLTGLVEFYLKERIDPATLFDVQVKRIHEYKRQILNLLRVVTLYQRLLDEPDLELTPQTVIIGGKAAPGYYMAKLIIRLANDIAEKIKRHPRIAARLRLLFIPNYDVSTASDIIPAADLSQQISTAGMEASGTGNMKLALNGALTVGTLDGANIEIMHHVGRDNIFIFGLQADEVNRLRYGGYRPRSYYENHPELHRALDAIAGGHFSPDEPGRYRPIVERLLDGGDHFMVLADYAAYMEACTQAADLYRDPAEWGRRALLNTARMGYFSSDRTVREYAEQIWGVEITD